jgi:D-alanyl-D-alanine carboxypeptidase
MPNVAASRYTFLACCESVHTLHMRRGAQISLAVVACVAVVGCGSSSADHTKVDRTTTASELFARDVSKIQSTIDHAVDTDVVPGIVVFVRRGDRTKLFASGLAVKSPREKMTAQHRFRIASISKPMVATVVLQLVDEGKLSLDDTVSKWLPDLVPGGDSITVEQLLNHSSGLVDYADIPRAQSWYMRGAAVTPKSLVALAVAKPPLFKPGRGAQYSSTNYVVLGLIVERVTGGSLDAALRQRIFDRLHMDATTFDREHTMTKPVAHGYDYGSDVTTADLSVSWAGGGVVSTASDVATFFRALLGGRLLPDELLDKMKSEVTKPFGAGASLTYGLGLMKRRTNCGPEWGHIGELPGFRTTASSLTNADRQVVILTNTGTDSVELLFGTVTETALCST